MIFFLFSLLLCGVSTRTIVIPPQLQPRNINAMTTDITCRWSNCNELCPIGFVSVPRKDGAKGEMMWDHTQCNGNGLSRLCCPSNQPQPICTWRGHSNNGNYKPGCQGGEVEVWSIGVGCKSGHQSACCTTNTPSIEAYDNCRWEGTAPDCWSGSRYHPMEPCSKLYPNTAIETMAGFGGEASCSHGTLASVRFLLRFFASHIARG
jgi:chitinase